MLRTRPVLSAALCLVLAGAAVRAQTVDYPQPDSREDIGDWVLECFAVPIEQCQIYQRILINKGSAIAMVATFAWDSTKQAMRTQIALPLGIDLGKGATISADNGYSITVALTRCTQQGCLIEGTVPEELLRSFAQSKSATISVVNPTQGPFAIPLSLRGFGEAMARIRPLRPASALQDQEPMTVGPGHPAEEQFPTPPDPSAETPERRFRPVTGDK